MHFSPIDSISSRDAQITFRSLAEERVSDLLLERGVILNLNLVNDQTLAWFLVRRMSVANDATLVTQLFQFVSVT